MWMRICFEFKRTKREDKTDRNIRKEFEFSVLARMALHFLCATTCWMLFRTLTVSDEIACRL